MDKPLNSELEIQIHALGVSRRSWEADRPARKDGDQSEYPRRRGYLSRTKNPEREGNGSLERTW